MAKLMIEKTNKCRPIKPCIQRYLEIKEKLVPFILILKSENNTENSNQLDRLEFRI